MTSRSSPPYVASSTVSASISHGADRLPCVSLTLKLGSDGHPRNHESRLSPAPATWVDRYTRDNQSLPGPSEVPASRGGRNARMAGAGRAGTPARSRGDPAPLLPRQAVSVQNAVAGGSLSRT